MGILLGNFQKIEYQIYAKIIRTILPFSSSFYIFRLCSRKFSVE